MRKYISMVLVSVMLAGTFAPMMEIHANQISEIDKMQYTEGEDVSSQGEQDSTDGANDTTVDSEPNNEQSHVDDVQLETEEVTIPSDFVETGLSPLDAKVIVLDPGHCKKHPGASGNGLREEVVTLDIAKACQEKLNQYADVSVYMTRTDGDCCETLNLGDCLYARNYYAKQLDADFLVSMHINAGASSGANVLSAYASGYNDFVRKQTQEFGKLALKKLNKLGIANRGLLLRKSEANTRYSNGKLADYYAIVRLGVQLKIPSVIIEHGYITSASDTSKYFKTSAKRKKVGQADANAIIEYYGIKKKIVSGTFEKIQGDTYFITKDGKKATGWVKDSGEWYYFDPSTAIMKTGRLEWGGKSFYLSESTGKMKTGWIRMDGKNYLAKGDGSLVQNETHSDGRYTYLFSVTGKQLGKGLHTVLDKTYYVDSKKHIVKNNIKKIKGKHYAFDEDGVMLYGCQKIGGKNYYFDPSTGVMQKKVIVKIEDAQYYYHSSGVRKTGFIKYGGRTYYFSPNTAKMVKGWKKINGKHYYFSKTTGIMQTNKWIGKYYVNKKGIRTKKK